VGIAQCCAATSHAAGVADVLADGLCAILRRAHPFRASPRCLATVTLGLNVVSLCGRQPFLHDAAGAEYYVTLQCRM